MKPLVHELLVVSAKVRNAPKDISEIVDWKRRLVKAIDMEILAGPYPVYYDEMEGNRGMTVATIIKTSHIVLHTWDECEPCMFELDIFSCAPIDITQVGIMLEEFGLIESTFKYMDRTKGFAEITS